MSRQKFCPRGDVAMKPESVGLTWPRAPVHAEDAHPWQCPNVVDGVAVIKVCGPLEHHGGGWWFDSYESILGRVEGAFADEDVTAVILDIDSPGGEVSGLQETVRSIRKMRAEYNKPLVAYANDEAYSAAYALACACDEIYLPEGGGVGSIGVIAELQNLEGAAKKAGVEIAVIRSGNRKAEGHPFLPITDSVKAHVQARVDGLAKQFFALVADVRPVSRKDLEALQGQCVYGKRAVNVGLADGIMAFDEVLSLLAESQFDKPPSSAVSFNPNDRLVAGDKDANAMAFEILRKKVAACAAALEAATTPAAKKKAMAAYAAAAEALAEAKVRAKVKKTYNKKTVEEETEEDDGEAESDDDGDDDGDDDDDDDSSSNAAASAEDDEDEEKAEDEKKMKKGKKAKSSLAAFAKSLTGQSTDAAAQQVLASMHEQAQQNAINAEKIAKLEAAAVESRRAALISSMVAAGQLKPAQLPWAKEQSIASLKSYQKVTPAMFAPRQAPIDESVHHAAGDATGTDGLTDFERKLCAEQGIKPETYKATRDGGTLVLPKVN